MPSIEEIRFWGAYSRGIPNEERIVLQNVSELPINLAPYGLILGWKGGVAGATPFPDFYYWFGEIEIAPRGWFFLYTGKGTTRITTTINSSDPAIVSHWDKESVIFQNPMVVPILFRLGALTIENYVEPPPQPTAIEEFRRLK